MGNVKITVSIAVLAASCQMETVRGQDVAAPVMPNVDLETAEGRELLEDRKAICRFFVLMFLEQSIQSSDEKGRHVDELAFIPEKALAVCPEDFRGAILKWKNVFTDAEKDAGSVSDDVKGQIAEEMRQLYEKYMIVQSITVSMEWAMREMGMFVENGIASDKEELSKRAVALKEKIESGKAVIPISREE